MGRAEEGDSLRIAMPCNMLGDRKPETCRGIFLDVEITSLQHHGICSKPNSQQPTCLQILWTPGIFPYHLPNFSPCLAHSQCHSNTWLIVNSQSPCQEKSGVEGIAGVYEEPSFRSLCSSPFFSIIDMKMLDIYNNALAWRTKQGRILTKYLVLTPPLRRPKSLTSAQLEISLQESPMNWILC